MVHSYGATVSHHCCGSSVELFPSFIEIGMDALQTIQPQAAGMNPYKLKKEFRGKITLHGTVDAQGWLQKADCLEIEKEVFHLLEEVGTGGGGLGGAGLEYLGPGGQAATIEREILEGLLGLLQGLGGHTPGRLQHHVQPVIAGRRAVSA